MANDTETAIFKDRKSPAGSVKETAKQERGCLHAARVSFSFCSPPRALASILARSAQLVKLLVLRIADAFRENGVKMPRDFLRGPPNPLFNKLIENLRASKCVVEPASFAAWRKRRESPDFGGGKSAVETAPLGKRAVGSVDYAGLDSDEEEGDSDGEGKASDDGGAPPEEAGSTPHRPM